MPLTEEELVRVGQPNLGKSQSALSVFRHRPPYEQTFMAIPPPSEGKSCELRMQENIVFLSSYKSLAPTQAAGSRESNLI